ncbi:hypothetical protein [Pseudobacteriovorax antillogorgiicola]|uniref:Uncharacterized protein n=1 Tax=Pseudobacteriovorax antillogorgiicola TaxID=1513793 RepID=A0A1Y6CQJ9_9BACT|nr:hypothetical protein [Pseudobacteriovorax antillogorgiicola]TCS42844.1 hypothetical protein EDD56_13910 [Pseudobacteriovorax antillogorgiicola]SMF81819.1 hypothetical protein SAMN06296036_1389 [Pseudobacteriovorax antillogorgiicola]
MEQNYGEFIVKILETLQKNGFPDNQVTLPLEKMYEIAYQRGLNFNKVLEFLKEREGIEHQKTDEKILFFKAPQAQPENFDLNQFDMSKMDEMMKQAEGMGGAMGNLFAQAKGILDKMSPDQVQNMMKMLENMPSEQKEELMRKAQDFTKTPQ